MRKAIARCLLLALISCSSKSHPTENTVDLSTREDIASSGHLQIKSNEAAETEEEGGTGAAMALEEGQMGKADAVEAARNAGVLGETSSGFDSANMYGNLGTGRYGTIGHGTGTGAGYGVGGGRGGMRGRAPADPVTAESYAHHDANGWIESGKDHLSTFAADVDTASYTLARRKLTEGHLPPADAVRVEEMVNYFKYSYAPPSQGKPFSVAMDMAPSPFGQGRQILRVGVSSKALSVSERKPANLVFLVDVSGSMQSPDKLPLAQRSLRILVDNLTDHDTVALVTYAGSTRVVLPPTSIDHKAQILAAIDDLQAGGGTSMSDGMTLAYAQAAKGIRPGAVSRVIVLSDGDANIGATSHEDILASIAGHVKEGVTLSTVGFGMGNYKDDVMEQLADKGNGNNVYIDGISAARRVFQEQLGSTLEVVAKDVKLQVDFDATMVKRYRLIGYENRDVADNDFRNDRVDAGEIGAGHQVTAVYELELADGHREASIATVRVRYKAPDGLTATEDAYPFSSATRFPTFASATPDLRFAFAAAAFADVLRNDAAAKSWDLATIKQIANSAADRNERKELVALIDRAIELR